jgi:pimeloyl-ACP methyl ester carboxylesterase
MRDGTRIHYRMRGRGAPAFVFVHGWCSNLTHWDAQLRHFGRRHRVLAVDRRGHGRSDAPAVGYAADRHAEDLAELMRSVAMRGAIAVGHAGGGPTTLALAAAHPRLVRALVLVDSRIDRAARLGDPSDPAGAALGGVAAALEDARGTDFLRELYGGFFSPHAGRAGRQALEDALRTPLAVAAAEIRSLAIDSEALARSLAQPVLWLSVGAADQAALAAVFRRVQFGQLVGSGHFPHIEVPAQLNAMIERFVATLPARVGRPTGSRATEGV